MKDHFINYHGMILGCAWRRNFHEGLFMRYLQVMGFVVIILGGMAGAAVGETRSKTDACLVTLYNYPAETPQDVSEKVSAKSLLGLKKNLRASKADENTHSQMGLPLQKHASK